MLFIHQFSGVNQWLMCPYTAELRSNKATKQNHTMKLMQKQAQYASLSRQFASSRTTQNHKVKTTQEQYKRTKQKAKNKRQR
jgi:hypothetical protein